jgi:diacylglycerol kinase (ATP)
VSKNQRIGIILNPTAGRGHAGHVEKELISHFRKKKIDFQLEKTKEIGHGIALAKSMANHFNIVIAAGGDGTMNEVGTGLLGSTTALGVLPIGSGNDFNRMVGMSKNVISTIDKTLLGIKKKFDVGSLIIRNETNRVHKKFFLNTLGIGIDAEIARQARQIKHIKGLGLYLIAALRALSTYKPNRYVIKDRSSNITEDAYLICLGNGNYEGGGFKMLPNAVPDDRWFDVCLIRTMSMREALPIIPKIIAGTHSKSNKTIEWKTRKISICSEEPFILHGDGEILETNAIEINVEMAKSQLLVMMPTF